MGNCSGSWASTILPVRINAPSKVERNHICYYLRIHGKGSYFRRFSILPFLSAYNTEWWNVQRKGIQLGFRLTRKVGKIATTGTGLRLVFACHHVNAKRKPDSLVQR